MNEHRSNMRSDEWYTPKHVFDDLRVTFDLDVAAPKEGPRHVPARDWFWENGLEKEWFGLVWMNPPFGHQKEKILWLSRFLEHGNGIALLPDRTSAPWWQEYAPQCDAVLFVSPKIKFERWDGSVGESPGTGTTLFAVGKKASDALREARTLGTCFIPQHKTSRHGEML
jgi:hypothetical protein